MGIYYRVKILSRPGQMELLGYGIYRKRNLMMRGFLLMSDIFAKFSHV
jgi:hypothetical protein